MKKAAISAIQAEHVADQRLRTFSVPDARRHKETVGLLFKAMFIVAAAAGTVLQVVALLR
jgi:hypothetical protein